MIIAGIQKQSLIEYPGRISAVLFLAGCNLRCQFCYVPHLVLPEAIKNLKSISQKKILEFLKERKKFLEAVAISGGEPTLNNDLIQFIREIKKMGYLVEIETNGTNPEMLTSLIKNNLLDFIAMDIKHNLLFSKYQEITGGVLTKTLFTNIKKSIKILLSGRIDYEFRTTMIKEFHTKEDILEICQKIKKAKIYYLQNYQPNQTLSGKNFTPFSEKEVQEIIEKGQKFVNIKFRKYF